MKVIIREYLASLRERNELDSLLPDLLSEMGLIVFSRPTIGVRQYGVDVGAFGSLFGGGEKVYLFSVKAGDIDRKTWSRDTPQDLKPSLDEIMDVYIQSHLPAEYKGKPIEICICFGGEIKEDVRQNLSGYQTKYTTEKISFSEWGGERLAGYIEEFLLKEELLPNNCRRFLRKSLSMIDEPDVSYKHFRELVYLLSDTKDLSPQKITTAIRQLYLCLWILYAWCREEDNLESAFQASELCLLHAWNMGKLFLGKKNKDAIAILGTLLHMQLSYIQICGHFLEEKILPYTGKRHALSAAVSPSNHVDVNLKMFDLLGRIALAGIWGYYLMNQWPDQEEYTQQIQPCMDLIDKMETGVKQLIANNPTLFTPIKDEHAIDVFIAAWFLALKHENLGDLHAWLFNMANGIAWQFETNQHYPCNLHEYYMLIEHPVREKEKYKEEVTTGSILYPYIASFAAVLGFDDVYKIIQDLKSKHLKHCNFQIWFPDDTTEEHLYKNTQNHGATLSQVPISLEKEKFLDEIVVECEASKHFSSLSAVYVKWWPLLFLAGRHYRIPVPMQMIRSLMPKPDNTNQERDN